MARPKREKVTFENLTIKQRNLLNEYILTGNLKQSSIRAGYSPKTSMGKLSTFLKSEVAQEFITKRIKEMEREKVANQEEVLEFLTRVMRGQEDDPTLVGVEENGEANVVYLRVSTSERIQAAKLLGKRYGTFVERVDMQHNGAVMFVDDILGAESNDD